jgi:CheY-like chemotaxis protein
MAAWTSLEGLRVLVIEDEALIGLDLEQMLEDLGCDVVRRSDASIDADALASLAVNAAVLDVALANGNSYPVADLLAELGIPFIFATGYESVDDRFHLVPLIQKPFGREELADALRRTTARKQAK